MIAQALVVAAMACQVGWGVSIVAAQPPKPAGRQPAPPPRPGATPVGWWRDAVFYTIDVRSFADRAVGPGAGDGIGDFTGLLERLDYLNDGKPDTDTDLGVTAIRLLAPLAATNPDGSGLMDFYSTHADYGSAEDVRTIIEECHLRGVRVVLDIPVDATSDKHPWFIDSAKPDSPMRACYRWSDTDLGGKGADGASPWRASGTRFYYAPAGPGLPALNYSGGQVAGVIAEAMRFWAKGSEVDGFVVRGARGLVEEAGATSDTPGTKRALNAMRTAMVGARPSAALFADGFDAATTAATYPPDTLDAALTDDLSAAILAAVSTADSSPLLSALETSAKVAPAGGLAHMLSGPGRARAATALAGDAPRTRVAAMLSLTLPGVPMIFAGDELGMAGPAGSRTPFPWTPGANNGFTTGTPWSPMSENAAVINAEAAAKNPASLLTLYKKLIRLRTGSPALRRGNCTPIVCDNAALVAFLRQEGDSAVLVVANLGDAALSEYALTLDAGPLKGGYSLTDELSGEKGLAPVVTPAGGLSDYRPVGSLAPRTGYVFVLKKD